MVQILSRRAVKVLGAVYLSFSLAFGLAAIAAHLLGQAVLDSIVGLFSVVVLLGVS
jgi:hypothetical protein